VGIFVPETMLEATDSDPRLQYLSQNPVKLLFDQLKLPREHHTATVLDENPFSKLCTKVCTNAGQELGVASCVLRAASA
jgi:hypothetical protein